MPKPGNQLFINSMENRTRWKSQSVLWKIKKPVWKHSHKKRKDSLETRVVFMEISMLSWNLPNVPKHWGSLLKKHGFLWRKSAICRWFSCSSGWNERWYASIYKELELEMDSLTSRILLQKASSYNYQFCTKVSVSLRLSLKFKWWQGKI